MVNGGINYYVDGKQLLLLMQLQEYQRRSRRTCAWSGPQNDKKLKCWLVLMQNGDFVPLVEAGIDLLVIGGNEARPQYLQ